MGLTICYMLRRIAASIVKILNCELFELYFRLLCWAEGCLQIESIFAYSLVE